MPVWAGRIHPAAQGRPTATYISHALRSRAAFDDRHGRVCRSSFGRKQPWAYLMECLATQPRSTRRRSSRSSARSPKQCLLLTHYPVGPLNTEVSSDWVDVINHRHAAFAPTTLIVRSKEARARWFEVAKPAADSWEALHPDPEDRYRWTSPDCPPEFRDIV